MVTNLKAWLRRQPQPASIRYTTPDDEERMLELSANARNRWSDAQEALESAGAVRIEALDKEGKVLRITKRDDEDGGELTDSTERDSKAKAKEMASLALVLDAQGRRINEAHEKGAEAASRGQDNLVQVVNILTAQWSATMNALQSASMNIAKLARQAGGAEVEDGEDDAMGQQLQQLLGLAAMKLLGGNMPGMPGADANGTNGTPPKKGK